MLFRPEQEVSVKSSRRYRGSAGTLHYFPAILGSTPVAACTPEAPEPYQSEDLSKAKNGLRPEDHTIQVAAWRVFRPSGYPVGFWSDLGQILISSKHGHGRGALSKYAMLLQGQRRRSHLQEHGTLLQSGDSAACNDAVAVQTRRGSRQQSIDLAQLHREDFAGLADLCRDLPQNRA